MGSEVPRALIVSGGVGHAFEETSAKLAELFAEEGIESETTYDVEAAFASLVGDGAPDLVTINALRWRMKAERYAPQRAEWEFQLSDKGRQALLGFLRAGGGLLGVHTASICFDDWQEWGRILGGRWNWDRSGHPPLGPVSVRVLEGDELVAGLTDFESFDEVYGFLDVEADVDVLMVSSHSGAAHPVMWRHSYGDSRVVYTSLGHDLSAYESASLTASLRRSARWVARLDDRKARPQERISSDVD